MGLDLESAMQRLSDNPSDKEAFEAAEEHHAVHADWRGLVALFARFESSLKDEYKKYWQRCIEQMEAILNESADAEGRSGILLEMGRIWEERVGRVDQAVACYQGAFKLWPLNVEALRRGRALYRAQGNWKVVQKLYELQLQVTEGATEQAQLLAEIGLVHMNDLGDKDSAAAYFARALEVDPQCRAAREGLDVAQGRVRDWAGEWAAHERGIAAAAEGPARVDAQVRAARFLIDEAPPGTGDAAPPLLAALEKDFSRGDARGLLSAWYRTRENWAALAELQERVGAFTGLPAEARAAVLSDLAALRLDRLGDAPGAFATAKKALELTPTAPAIPAARAATETTGDWAKYVELLDRVARGRGKPEAAADVVEELAEVAWKKLHDMAAAEKHFKRLRLVDAKNVKMLRFQAELAEGQGDPKKHLTALQALRDAVEDAGEKIELSSRMAELAEGAAGVPEKAIDAWKAVLKIDPDHERARSELGRLLESSGKWNALLEHLKDEIERLPESDVSARVALYLRMVGIYRDQLRLDVMVINTYNSILHIDPGNGAAIDALAERYEKASRWNDLVAILQRKVDASDSTDEQVALLARIAEIWRTRLGNATQAIAPLEQIVTLRPEDLRSIEALKQIYEGRRDYERLLATIDREVPLLPAPDRVGRLRDAAKMARTKLKDEGRAAALFERLIEAAGQPDEEALHALQAFYQREERWDDLARVQEMRLPSMSGDAAAKLAAELGALQADRLGNVERAIGLWERALAAKPSDTQTLGRLTDALREAREWDRLESLYGARGEWEAVADLFDIVAQGSDSDVSIPLYRRLARISRENLSDRSKEISALESLLAVDPIDAAAAEQLEPLYAAAGEHARRVGVLEIQLRNATEDAKNAIRLRLGDVHERELGDGAGAYRWLSEAWQQAPSDQALRDRVQAVAVKAGLASSWWETLRATTLAMDEGDVRAENFRQLARLAAGPIAEPDESIHYYERLRTEKPEDGEALDHLAVLYGEKQRWTELAEILQAQLALASGAARAALLHRVAALRAEKLDDPRGAIEACEALLADAPTDRAAVRLLRSVRASMGDWTAVVEACQREISLARSLHEEAEPLHAMAAAQREHLGDGIAAIASLRRLLDVALESDHGALAIGELRALLQKDDLRAAAADVLEPALRKLARWAEVVEVIEARLLDADDATSLRLYTEMAVISESELRDPEAAYGALGQLLLAQAAEPATWDAMERLARDSGSLPDLATRWTDAVERHGARALADLLPRLARVQEADLRDMEGARDAWSALRSLDANDARALDGLERAFRAMGDAESLVALLVERAESATGAERVTRWLEAAGLFVEPLGRPEEAIPLFSHVTDADPARGEAWDALESIHDRLGDGEALAALLERRAAVTPEPAQVRELRVRRGGILAERLGDRDGALREWAGVLASDPSNAAARGGLARLLVSASGADQSDLRAGIRSALDANYRSNEMWRELSELLDGSLGDAEEPEKRVALRTQLASLHAQKLGEEEAAFEHLREAVREGFADAALRERLESGAAQLGKWGEVAALYETVLETLDSDELRYVAMRRLAAIYLAELRDPSEAISRFEGAVALRPEDADSLRELESLYRAAGSHAEYVRVELQLAQLAPEAADRSRRLDLAATVIEEELGDRARAIEVREGIRGDVPNDDGNLSGLERLYRASEAWTELADVLSHRMSVASGPDAKAALHLSRASVLERSLDDRAGAIEEYRAVLGLRPGDAPALEALDRLFEQEGDAASLSGVLRERIAGASRDARTPLQLRLARLLVDSLDSGSEAVAVLREVLERDPENADARALLERMLDAEIAAEQVGAVLAANYELADQWEALVRVYRVRATQTGGDAQLAYLDRASHVQANAQKDVAGAFATALEAYRLSGGAGSRRLEVERLGRVVESWDRLVEVYEEVLLALTDASEAQAVRMRAAELYRTRLNRPSEAESHYRAVVDADPRQLEALQALDRMYSDGSRWDDLLDVLGRQESALGDPAQKVEVLHRMASVQEDALQDVDGAISTLRRVLDADGVDERAFHGLRRILAAQDRWREVADLIAARRERTSDPGGRNELTFELAEVQRIHLEEAEAAVGTLREVLAAEPNHAGARRALESLMSEHRDAGAVAGEAAALLEPLYRRMEDWGPLANALAVRAEFADQSGKIGLLDDLAAVRRSRLGDAVGAFDALRQRMEADASSDGVQDSLIELGRELDRWTEVAACLEDASTSARLDDAARIRLLHRLAEVYEAHTEQFEQARDVHQRVLSIDSASAKSNAALERLYQRLAAWDDLISLYRRQLEGPVSGARRKELLAKIARIYEDVLEDSDAAVEAHRAILAVEPADAEAQKSLEHLFHYESRWADLAELLLGQISHAADAGVRMALWTRLGLLRRTEMQSSAEAVDAFEKALEADAMAAPPREALEEMLAAARGADGDEALGVRIAGLLEPLYDPASDTARLVDVYEAQIGGAGNSGERVSRLRRLAELLDRHGNDGGSGAWSAWLRALREAPREAEVQRQLERLAQAGGRWEALREALAATAAACDETEARGNLLLWLAEVVETRLNSDADAADVFRQAIENQPSDAIARDGLERVLGRAGLNEELIAAMSDRAESEADPTARRAARVRLAEMFEKRLGDRVRAAEAWRTVLDDNPDDAVALDAIERLFREESDWESVTGVLETRVQLADSDARRKALFCEIGSIRRDRQGRMAEAAEAYRAARDIDPADVSIVDALVDLYGRTSAWSELFEALSSRRELCTDDESRNATELRMAEVLLDHQADPETAISHLAQILSRDPRHAGARVRLSGLLPDAESGEAAARVLEQIYRNSGEAEKLVDVLERRARGAEDDAQRFALLSEMARICSDRLSDPRRAFDLHCNALVASPTDLPTADSLCRLAGEQGLVPQLVVVLDEVLSGSLDTDTAVRLGLLSARYQRIDLSDPAAAAERYEQVLEHSEHNAEALQALDEIYSSMPDSVKRLAAVLDRQTATGERASRNVAACRLAELHERQFGEPERALELYRGVVGSDPSSGPAIAGLERLLARPDLGLEVVDVLDPIYRDRADWESLCRVLEVRAERTDESVRRAEIFTELGDLHDSKLGSAQAAFADWGRAVREEPGERRYQAEFQRLALRVDRRREWAQTMDAVSDRIEDSDLARSSLYEAGRCALDELREPELAEKLLNRVLAIEPESAEALEALDRLYTAAGNHAKLVTVLRARVESTYDPAAKTELLFRLATLAETQLGDSGGASAALEGVLELDSTNARALSELERVARAAGDWVRVSDLLDRRASAATDTETVFRLRVEIARVAVEKLQDIERAILAFEEVLAVDPKSATTIRTLCRLYEIAEKWDELKEMQSRAVEATTDEGEQVSALLRLATLCEERFDDISAATGHLRRALGIAPSNKEVRDGLRRLLRAQEEWAELSRLLVGDLDTAHGTDGTALHVEIAMIAIEHLHEEKLAEEHLNAVLTSEPGHREAQVALARLYQQQGRWDDAAKVLREQLPRARSGEERARILAEIAGLRQRSGGEPSEIRALYEESFAADRSHMPAREALEAIYEDAQEWALLLSLLEEKTAMVAPGEKLAHLRRIADIARNRVSDAGRAAAALEQAYALSPESLDVADQLLQTYLDAGKAALAGPVLDRIIAAGTASKTSPAGRELYRFLHLRGRLAEAGGDVAGALRAYTESQALNGSFFPNQIALGKLLFVQEKWEDSIKVFQAVLLNQANIRDERMKVDVFYHLGCLRQKTNDPRRARDMFTRALSIDANHQPSKDGLASLK